MELKKTAYPKVNLHLSVGKKRADGFHEIATVYYLLKDSYYNDEITINIENAVVTSIIVTGLEDVADSVDNTVYKAAELYLKEVGIKANVNINVKKGIPTQSGLGGESSDAAAVFCALCEYVPVSKEKIMRMSEQIGSDVSFFSSGYVAAAGFGRGEELYQLPEKDIQITLYPNNDEKMSTKEAYEKMDSRKKIKRIPSLGKLRKIYSRPVEKWTFFNDFEVLYDKRDKPGFKLTGSGTCRYTIDLLESKR